MIVSDLVNGMDLAQLVGYTKTPPAEAGKPQPAKDSRLVLPELTALKILRKVV